MKLFSSYILEHLFTLLYHEHEIRFKYNINIRLLCLKKLFGQTSVFYKDFKLC